MTAAAAGGDADLTLRSCETRDEHTSRNIRYYLVLIWIKSFYNLNYPVICVAWSKNFQRPHTAALLQL